MKHHLTSHRVKTFLHATATRSRPGAMLLITVLIAGAVALTISLNVAMQGIGELSMGLAENQSQETLAVADGCLQESLLRLSRNSGFAGGAMTIGDGNCMVTVTSSGFERTIAVTAALGRWTRKIQARVNLTGSRVVLLEWKQISN